MCQAIRLAGGRVAMRLIAGATPQFRSRLLENWNVPEASVVADAIDQRGIYADDGGFIRIRSDEKSASPVLPSATDGLRR